MPCDDETDKEKDKELDDIRPKKIDEGKEMLDK